MTPLLRLIILRNWRPLAILCAVVLLATTGFLVMRQLTTNIEMSISRETRPIF